MSKPCANCEKPVDEQYCSYCGEKRITDKELSMGYLLNQLFVSLTDVDGKLISSIKFLMFYPGRLTKDYFEGIRHHRINPFQLFILINILYFLFISFNFQDAFATLLQTHLNANNFIHQGIAFELIQDKIQAGEIVLESYRLEFNKLTSTLSKSLLIFLIPILAVTMLPVFWKEKNRSVVCIVFASHFVSAALFFMVVFGAYGYLLSELLKFLQFPNVAKFILSDYVYSILITAYSIWYFYRGLGLNLTKVSKFDILKAIYLFLAFYWAVLVYRMILFFVTFYSL